MKQLMLKNSTNSFKEGDTSTVIDLQTYEDDQPANITGSVSVVLQSESSQILSVSGTLLTLSTVRIYSSQLSTLKAGIYEMELWVKHDDDTVEIYPDTGAIEIQINPALATYDEVYTSAAESQPASQSAAEAQPASQSAAEAQPASQSAAEAQPASQSAAEAQPASQSASTSNSQPNN